MGGFDRMTAIVGGLWDSLLGEGRRFWIVAASDSHVHHSEPIDPGSDLWPGEFHKTYVHARNTHDDILEGLRDGRMFAVAGDLITGLELTATADGSRAGIGETLRVTRGATVELSIRFTDPIAANHHGDTPGEDPWTDLWFYSNPIFIEVE